MDVETNAETDVETEADVQVESDTEEVSENNAQAKESAILVVSFGTSYNDNRDASIGAVENVSGEFSLNMRRRTLTRGKEELELTPVEYQLLEILFEAKGDTVERNFILKRIWGDTFLGEDKIVDVNIRRLRMKIEEEPSEPRHILTVRGIGYRWKD